MKLPTSRSSKKHTTPKQTIEQQFALELSTALRGTTPPECKPDILRVSLFPYCGLRSYYESKYHTREPETGYSQYFKGSGNLIHSVLHSTVPLQYSIVGDWKCPVCPNIKRFQLYEECEYCKVPMEYQELDLDLSGIPLYENVKSCHVDSLYVHKGEYYVVEYKSCNNPEPKLQHFEQALSYGVLLEEVYDIEVAGAMVVYIQRTNLKPTIFLKVLSEPDKDLYRSRIAVYSAQYKVLQNLRTFDDLLTLAKIKTCYDEVHYDLFMGSCSPCPMSAVCFSANLEKYLRQMWKL